jgi:SNF2 family DNA or RNA helicase
MKLLPNSGKQRVIDELVEDEVVTSHLDLATSGFSLFAFAELRPLLSSLTKARLLLSMQDNLPSDLVGGPEERSQRNRLLARHLARLCSQWIDQKAEVRFSPFPLPQSAFIPFDSQDAPNKAIVGQCPLTLQGLGLAPSPPLAMIQSTDEPSEAAMFAAWFQSAWVSFHAPGKSKDTLLAALHEVARDHAPGELYYAFLSQLFGQNDDLLDEESIIKSATGFKKTVVWNKLFKFQRDGVIGSIDKLNRYGGCIIADSVGLGKTFEALAVIKYHELRGDRVLVLCPKRLRDNWTLYAANDRRNILAADRFNYKVLNHTDLSRDTGPSGDIDLKNFIWSNFDLVVIDESHNFRNKKSPKQGGETRYDRLMRQIIKSGVKTKVLMLSATPVNNRLADLRNQISFITEGDDAALADHGIKSIESTVQRAQKQFNEWLRLKPEERKTSRLVDMLGFDYFKLLDIFTIARSRKHIEKYFGTEETGTFPERLQPINRRPGVDLLSKFPTIKKINDEIRKLNLAAYAPLNYVLPHRKDYYDELYSTKLNKNKGIFRQADREQSLIHLMRVNLLKRMESAVSSFSLTLERQLFTVDAMLAKVRAHEGEVEEPDLDDFDPENPLFESLTVGRSVKVRLADLDLIRWEQDLVEDRNRLSSLLSAAQQIGPERDEKLSTLKEIIAGKLANPINPDNRKLIIFTAFADTANYLYDHLAKWAESQGAHMALLTGSGKNRTTLKGLPKDQLSLLTAFAPLAKGRPADLAAEGELEILIATDCISEGQNLQDCDYLINYDIHWNPVRIIQRFGRIDRIGSPNARIQLVNFWPNMELDEYIDLEQRVSGRMVLLDVSATGEENVIEVQSGDPMNDLDYRREQLLKLQTAVVDLEDLSGGVSITDLTLTDFRMDLAEFRKSKSPDATDLPLGSWAVTTAAGQEIPPGIIFCLRAESHAALEAIDPAYPLSPHFLVNVSPDGEVLLTHIQARMILDRMKRAALHCDAPDAAAYARFDKLTKNGAEMGQACAALAAAVTSIVGKTEEKSAASLFSLGGTTALPGEFRGVDDFEVVGFLVLLPEL